jgi:hypothetical protein
VAHPLKKPFAIEKLAVILLLLFTVGCTKAENMPVVFFTNTWDIGEVKECQSTKVPQRKLICSVSDEQVEIIGLSGESANSPGAVRLLSLVNHPKTFSVTFKGSGESSIFKDCIDWNAAGPPMGFAASDWSNKSNSCQEGEGRMPVIRQSLLRQLL